MQTIKFLILVWIAVTTLILPISHADLAVVADDLLKMRDVSVFMRVPKLVCAAKSKHLPQLSAAGASVYQGLLSDLLANLNIGTDMALMLSGGAKCRRECTCQIWSDVAAGLKDAKASAKLSAVVDGPAQKMTDTDFKTCQGRLRLTCQSPVVTDVVRSM